MEKQYSFQFKKFKTTALLIVCMLGFQLMTLAQDRIAQETSKYVEYKGTVVDDQTNDPLIFATLSVNGTNISTITNNEGEFSLKVPDNVEDGQVTVSFLGYQKKIWNLSDFKPENTRISLYVYITPLEKVDVNFPKDAKSIVRATFKRKGENNLNDQTLMTAFYRETIKKRRKNASLTEAVVNIYKQPYSSSQNDLVKLYKARKSTNYDRLDTIALKLQGGPFNTLYGDLMKYPEYIFSEEMFEDYVFSFDPSTRINGQTVYVINFKARQEIVEPSYFGKLYIDSKNLALTRATYSLNVENRKLASELFVRKKPNDVDVYPTKATYRVDYREKDGKWYYGYSNVQLEFKVNKRRKLFNSVYSLSCEMAVTDWELNSSGETLKPKERLKPTVVINDEVSGFSDPEFWGPFNVIEPEKSIESAIEKIKKQITRANRNGGNAR